MLSYLDQEEMNSECWQSSGQLDILVLGVNLRGSTQVAVLGEDLLLHVAHLHETQRQKLFQAAKKEALINKLIYKSGLIATKHFHFEMTLLESFYFSSR